MPQITRIVGKQKLWVNRLLIALLGVYLAACGGSVSFYFVGGSVTGLVGSGLVLEINGGAELPIAANGTFDFTALLTSGSSYTVAVKTQPSASNCVVTNASGVVGGSNVGNVTIECSALPGFVYTIDPSNQIVGYGIRPGTDTWSALGSTVAAGSLPRSLIAAPSGSALYVSDWNSGSIEVYTVDATTGVVTPLGAPIATGAPGSRPMNMIMSASGAYLYVSNVGASNVVTFSSDSKSGGLTAVGTPLTFGGRTYVKFAMTPDDKFLYMMNFNDIGSSPATLTVYAVDAATGALTAGTTTTLAVGAQCMGMDPLGRFVFVVFGQSNPNAASTTVIPYTIDPTTGAVTASASGTTLNNNGAALVIEPSGRTAYLMDSFNFAAADDHIDALSIDQESGALAPLGSLVLVQGQPITLVVDPSGQYLVVASSGANADATWYDVSVFAISRSAATLGELTPAGLGTSFASSVAGAGLVAVIE